MSFILPDLIVESVLRDGFEVVRRYPDAVEDVFASLTYPYAERKYGSAEIEKIKNIIQNREVSIVHSFNLVAANLPCISIQLTEDRESEDRAHMGNYRGFTTRQITDPVLIAALVKVPAFTIISYNTMSGAVLVPDSVDLSAVHTGLLLHDSAGVTAQVVGGIVNALGAKQFMIAPGQVFDQANPIDIRSSLDYEMFMQRGNVESTQLMLGIHTKDALLTKYLYTLVKYFMLSRKNDMIKRGMQLNTYNGSDFTRNMEYAGDVVYTRFFNISGTIQHFWRADKIRLVDQIDTNIKSV